MTSIDRILKLPEVTKLCGLSKSSVYQYMKNGHFPKCVSLGMRSVGWKASDIENWILSRV